MFYDNCIFKALQVLSGIFSSVSTAFVSLHFPCYALTDAYPSDNINRTFRDDENILFLHHPTQQALASPASRALETWTVMLKMEFQMQYWFKFRFKLKFTCEFLLDRQQFSSPWGVLISFISSFHLEHYVPSQDLCTCWLSCPGWLLFTQCSLTKLLAWYLFLFI